MCSQETSGSDAGSTLSIPHTYIEPALFFFHYEFTNPVSHLAGGELRVKVILDDVEH